MDELQVQDSTVKKIIDSFIFFNEFDIVKLRLNYLNDAVDYFIVCESNYTHSGKLKPYYFDQVINDIPENIRKKIIRLKYEPDISEFTFPDKVNECDYTNSHWKLERGHRNHITTYLSNFSPDDILMVSDVDEIPNRKILKNLVNQITEDSIFTSKCKMFYYNFKTFVHDEWNGTIFTKVKTYIKFGSEYFRGVNQNFFNIIEDGGWHFSYFGDSERIRVKLQSFAHQEFNKDNITSDRNIINSIKQKKYLFNDNYNFTDYNFNNFPEDIQEFIIEYFPNQYYMKIFIFGSNGMLGNYLTQYLSSSFEVIPITRGEIDLTKDFSLIEEKYQFNENDVIINASGIIKQRDYCSDELIKVNSLFPHFLSTLGCNVIHITTDCVFSGKEGSYTEESYHDCIDDYGKSKSLGECEDLTIIRTSIIGEEVENKKSLIEWVKSNKNTNVNGYLNHFWNGVTCLELSKQIEKIIKTNTYWKGVRHYFSPDTVSKYQLVSYINEIYKLNNTINPVMSEYCDRSLNSNYKSPIKKQIKNQILELKNFDLYADVKNKMKNFPSFNFVSITESEDRRKALYENFENYGIEKVIPHIYDRYNGDETNIKIKNWWGKFPAYIGAITSHLKAIHEWYYKTDEPYAFFCEDDISFETIKYWNFTWEEFLNNLPEDWDCVQLAVSRNQMFLFWQPEVYLRNRCWDDYSCVAYLISRDHAKKLLDSYYDGDTFVLEYDGFDKNHREEWACRPSIETLIYTNYNSNIYCFPLFVENINLDTTVWFGIENADDEDIKTKNIRSQNFPAYHKHFYNTIVNWWKKRGKNLTLSDFNQIREFIIERKSGILETDFGRKIEFYPDDPSKWNYTGEMI